MTKPNTMMAIILEPKEYSTNTIIDFVDEALTDGTSSRRWIKNAIFVMNKFDLRMPDSETGSKTNKFLDEFWANKLHPFFVFTPSLQAAIDDASPEDQYMEREKLLKGTDETEQALFKRWMTTMDRNNVVRVGNSDCKQDPFDPKFKPYLGFSSLLQCMHGLLLQNAIERLPDIIFELQTCLASIQTELEEQEREARLREPGNFKLHVAELLTAIKKKVLGYLDGSLDVMQKLDEVIPIVTSPACWPDPAQKWCPVFPPFYPS